jgi:Spy/CpxP family protein refolding chaperone
MSSKPMTHSPWAGEQTREIKSLTARELTGIPKGHGVGMALPAELNSYPGPRHALDLSEELNLTSEQKEQIELFYQEMSQQAVPLGQQFIEIEKEIDGKFVDKSITSEELSELLKNSSDIKWQLRNIHLQAHLKTADVLSLEQISLYDQLRGYAEN